jgi:nucleoside-diphosphate-sugar epimerase
MESTLKLGSTVLVTGASGFIGKRLVETLLSQGKDVLGIVRQPDSARPVSRHYKEWVIGYGQGQLKRIEELFNEQAFEQVFHCATLFKRSHSDEDIRPLIEANEIFGCYILELSSKCGVTSFVNLASSWQLQGQIDQNFNSLYAVSKQAFLSYLDFYAKKSTMNILNYYLYETISALDSRDKVFNGIAVNLLTGSRMRMGNPNTVVNLSNVDLVCEQLAMHRQKPAGETQGVRHLEILNFDDISLERLVHKFELISGLRLALDWGVYKMPTINPFWRGDLAYDVERITVRTNLDREIRLKLAATPAPH